MSGVSWLPDPVGLALVGYRGTGKSTVGRIVANLMSRAFVDADTALEARLGRSIGQVFEQDGEPAFRDWEESVLAELTALPHKAVLATGGGVVLRESNRRLLRRFGVVIWLRAEPGVLAARLATDTQRPALTSAGTLDEIGAVLAQRESLYHAVADAVVDTNGKDADAVSHDVISALSAVYRESSSSRWSPS